MALKSQDSYPGWADDARVLLENYEKQVTRWPRGEITSRCFHRLRLLRVTNHQHLRALLPRLIKQILADLARKERRESKRQASVDPCQLPASDAGWTEELRQHLDRLAASPALAPSDRKLLALITEQPWEFLWPNGEPRQAVLGEALGCDEKTAGKRWRRLKRKLAAPFQPEFDLL